MSCRSSPSPTPTLAQLRSRGYGTRHATSRDDISQPQRDGLCWAIVSAARKLEDPAERQRASELFAASGLPVLESAAEEVGCDHDFIRSTENFREDVESRYRYWEVWQTCSKCGKREFVFRQELWGDECF